MHSGEFATVETNIFKVYLDVLNGIQVVVRVAVVS